MRRAALGAIVLVCAATLSLCAEPIDRDALIRQMIDSRLLENAHFQVPVSVYQRYVREALLPAEPEPAPVGAIVEEAQFHLSVPPEAQGKPLLKLTLRLRVFDPARVKQWPIFPPGVSWDKMTVNGRAGELPRTKGIFTWTAEAPLMEATAEGASLKLEAPGAVRTLVRFDSPGPWQVWDNVQGDWGPTGSAEGGTHEVLAAPPSGTVVLRYRRPRPVSQRPPRYELRGNIVWNLDAAGQQVTARLAVAITGGRTDRIDLILPPAAERVRVTGPDVRQAQPGDGQVSVFLRGKIRDQTRLQLTYELPSPARAAALSFGRLGVRDGHWAGGCLIVTNTAGGNEVMAESATGLAELPLWAIPRAAAAMLPGPAALAYEITGRDFSAAVELVDLGEFALRESIVDLAHFELLFRADGSVLCKGRYEVRNRSRQFLKLSTPPGSLVMIARVNDKPVPLSAVAGEPGAYRLPLVRSLGSVQGLVSFPVEVVLLWRAAALKPGRGQIELPLPRVDIPIAYAWCQTYVPQGMKVRQWSGPLRSVKKYSSETATAYLGYGRGELAEGYDAKDRLQMVTAPPPARQPRPGVRKPSAKPAQPEPAKRPDKPSPVTLPKLSTTPKGPVKRGPRVVGALPAPSATPPAARPPAPTDVARPGRQGKAKRQPGRPTDRMVVSTEANLTLGTGSLGVQLPAKPTGKMALSLARNYYRSGNEFYANNDFAGAATAMNKVLELAPASSEAANARLMLGNIRLARGELALRTKGEKAAAAKVRLAQQEALRPVLEQRRQAIRAAQKSLAAGEHEQARAQLQVADALARQGAVTTGPAWRGRGSGGGGAPSDRDNLEALRDQVQRAELEKVQQLADKYQQLKAAGKYDQALKAGRKLQIIGAGTTIKRINLNLSGGRLTLGGASLTDGTYRSEGDLSVDSNAALTVTLGTRAATRPAEAAEHLDEDLRDLALLAAKKRARERITSATKDRLEAAHIRKRPDGTLTYTGAANVEHLYGLAKFDVRAGAVATPATAPAAGPRPEGRYVAGEVTKPEDEKEAQRVGMREEQKQVAETRLSLVPWYNKLTYPREGEQITVRRDQPSEMAEPTEAKPGADRVPVTRVYDVNDLVVSVPAKIDGAPVTVNTLRITGTQGIDLEGRTITVDSSLLVGGRAVAGDELDSYDKARGVRTKLGEEELVQSIQEVIESAGLPDGARVQMLNGKLVVSAPGDLQAATGELLNELRKARGPQVAAGGERLADQRARGLKGYGWVSLGSIHYDRDRDGPEARRSKADAPPAEGRVRKFIEYNYDWALNQPAADGRWASLVEALGRNLEQKVAVNSTNLNVDAPTAGRLGVRFVAGRNDTNLAVIDEAQLRTLLELDARRAGKPNAVPANVRFQETIVGTDARLANGMIANAAFAGDRRNTIDINDNPIRLRHEQYILINNGTYLTAVRVGPMQHWTEPAADVRFAEVGHQIDVPRVGRLVKFEKTLVQPKDNLIIRASYQWKGDAR